MINRYSHLNPDQQSKVLALISSATDVDGIPPVAEHVLLHLRHGGDKEDFHLLAEANGEVLGYDEYTAEEAEEIEAEAAEIALKRAYSEESRMDLAKRGFALPDGSYPIKDRADLENAIRAYGRAKDKAAAKAHIMKRARALGAESLIPENWKAKAGEKTEDAPDAEFLAALAEFQILEAETDII